MHVRSGAIARDRFERWQAHGANTLFATFAEYPHRLGVRIEIGYIERSQLAQSQAAAVK